MSEQSSCPIRLACDSNLDERSQSTTVLGLRYFVCEGCETVYADVEKPPRCSNCDADPIVEVKPEIQAATYFSGW